MNDINNLNNEIFIVQMENRFNNIEKNEKRKFNKVMKKLLLMFVPYISSIVLSLVFKNPIVLIGGSTYFITLSVKEIIKESKKFNNYLKNKYDDKKIENHFYSDEDFYTHELKFEIEKEKNIMDKTIDKYSSKLDEIKKLSEIRDDFDKEEAINKINDDINLYYYAYNIPPFSDSINFSDYYNKIYEYLEKKGNKKEFYNVISSILKYTFSMSLINRLDVIDIIPLIDSIDFVINDTKANRTRLKKDILNSYKSDKKILNKR